MLFYSIIVLSQKVTGFALTSNNKLTTEYMLVLIQLSAFFRIIILKDYNLCNQKRLANSNLLNPL